MPWGLAGGLICGSVWALGEIAAHELVYARLSYWTTVLIAVAAAGVGGGALIGATFGQGQAPETEQRLRRTALAVGAALGFSAGQYFALQRPSAAMAIGLGVLGVALAMATAIPGRLLGLRFRPAVIFFEQLWPYLREMGMPLAAFTIGYFCLTLTFAGFYGTLWRMNPTTFRGLPAAPHFWDFAYFSLMTASTANTEVSAVSASAQILVAAEVTLGMGWLIVVFGALSAHLAPRLEAIAQSVHSRNAASPRL